MDVVASNFEFFSIANTVVRESTLPDGKFLAYTMGKAPLISPTARSIVMPLRSHQKMNMVRHDHKDVQLVVSLTTVLLQGFKE
jgi:hypothetical protein